MAVPRRILLVEDDLDIREAIASSLDRAGYDVVRAGNGRQAIDRLCESAQLPDLIVLDWMMPVMSGFEFLQYLATEPSYRAIQVLILSAVDRALTTTGLHVTAVLNKPVRMRTLVDVIDKLCGLPRRPDHLFPTGRYPSIGTSPPWGDAIPTAEIDRPSAPSTTRPTLVIRAPRTDRG
jgi:two-component system, OmpR family, response regulator CpxR